MKTFCANTTSAPVGMTEKVWPKVTCNDETERRQTIVINIFFSPLPPTPKQWVRLWLLKDWLVIKLMTYHRLQNKELLMGKKKSRPVRLA